MMSRPGRKGLVIKERAKVSSSARSVAPLHEKIKISRINWPPNAAKTTVSCLSTLTTSSSLYRPRRPLSTYTMPEGTMKALYYSAVCLF